MRALCLIAVLVAGCDEEDDFCDPNKHVIGVHALDTSSGDFVDNYDYANDWGIQATALDGVQHVDAASYDDCGTPLAPSAVTASSDAPAILTATAVGGEEVEVHAYQAGSALVHFANDAGLVSTLTFDVKPIDHIRLVSPELGEPTAFYRGAPFARIMLLAADDTPLVDRSLEVTGDLARGARWNEIAIAGAPTGDHEVVLLAGGSGWTTTVRVVDTIDSIVVIPGLTGSDACFRALLGNDIVGGVPWQLDIDRGYFYGSDQANCISVYRAEDGPPSITVTAHALGQAATTTITFPVGY